MGNFSFNTKILDALKSTIFFMGFRIQICVQILTFKFVKNCFSQIESENYFLEEECYF